MLPVEIATRLRNFLSITFTSVGLGATTGMAARTTKWLEDVVILLGASGSSSAAEIAEHASTVSKMQVIDFIVANQMAGALSDDRERLLWWHCVSYLGEYWRRPRDTIAKG